MRRALVYSSTPILDTMCSWGSLFTLCLAVSVMVTASHAPIQQCSFPDAEAATQHLSQIIQFKTVSETALTGAEEFRALNSWLLEAYPEIGANMQIEQVGEGQLSLLLTWQGSQPNLNPVLFISHTDVVPVEQETLKDWLHPPFSGAVADGFIWGRGAQDVKVGVISLLEAATALLRDGFKPQTTLMFAFGHDEEIGGAAGAAHIAALLKSRGVQLEMVIDEGVGVSIDGLAPFTHTPTAVISTAEKNIQTVQVILRSEGGHSSRPPIDGSSIGDRLARLLTAISKHPPPARLIRPTTDFLQAITPVTSGWLSVMLRGVTVFPPLRWVLAKAMALASAEAASLVRSTAVVTGVTAGIADNVIPQTATVKINFRLLPGDTPEAALEQTKQWLGRDIKHAEVSLSDFATRLKLHPMAVADASGPHYAIMQRAIQGAWRLENTLKPVATVPLLMPAMTDSRHYAALSPNGALRWTPGTFSKAGQELGQIHGVNERIHIRDFVCGLVTYRELLRGFGEYAGAAKAAQAGAQEEQTPGSSATEL